MKTLKEMWSLYLGDIKNEGFAAIDIVKYGLPATLAIMVLCALAEWLNK